MSQTQVLARKWRPRSFADLAGQEHVVRALTNALEQERLHHAYLFTGTRGVGKTTIARILAKALNCATGITARPCGACQPCTEIDGGRFVDLIELDAASNTQVDQMRDLLENALYAPTSARFKVYIIDEVHMLSRSAFNAMLKTLEEPPAHVKFLLATTDPQKIPVTVLSRCLQFNLKQLPPAVIHGRLRYVLEQEGVSFEAGALQLLARAAQGSMRDALSLLDQAIAFGGGKVEEAAIRSMLGSVDRGYLVDLLHALAGQDGRRLIALADEMESRSLSFEAALQELAALLHRLALAQVVPESLSGEAPEDADLRELAGQVAPEDVQLWYQIAIHARRELDLAPDEYAGFTMALTRMLAFCLEGAAPAGGGGARPARPATPAPAPSPAPAPVRSVAAPASPAPHRVEESLPPQRPAGRTPVPVAPAEDLSPKRAADPVPVAPAQSAPRVQPSPAPTGGPESRTANASTWRDLVAQLRVAGMAKMLAQHCELRALDGDRVELVVPEAHRHLMDKAYQDKLRAAVCAHFGRDLRVSFERGAAGGNTPAEIENRERDARQAKAIAAIEGDPAVRDLIEQFDARLIGSSIRPNQ